MKPSPRLVIPPASAGQVFRSLFGELDPVLIAANLDLTDEDVAEIKGSKR